MDWYGICNVQCLRVRGIGMYVVRRPKPADKPDEYRAFLNGKPTEFVGAQVQVVQMVERFVRSTALQ